MEAVSRYALCAQTQVRKVVNPRCHVNPVKNINHKQIFSLDTSSL